MNTNVNKVLEEFQNLQLNDMEYVAEIIQKQVIETRRDFLAARICEAKENYAQGRTKSGSVRDLMKDMEGSRM